jgi:hypothetical protein
MRPSAEYQGKGTDMDSEVEEVEYVLTASQRAFAEAMNAPVDQASRQYGEWDGEDPYYSDPAEWDDEDYLPHDCD